MSIHWPILKRLAGAPFRTAIVDDLRSYRGIDVLMGALHVAGAVRGKCGSDTIGVLLPTGGMFPIAALAGWMLGKTVVPLNYLLKKDELHYVIKDCGTDTVVSSRLMLGHMGIEPEVRSVVCLEDVSFKGVPEPLWPASAESEDLGVLLYTSGTNGRPKGVMLTHANIEANMRQVHEWIAFTPADVMMGVLPQFHSFGLTVLTLLPLTVGLKVVYTARFMPAKIVKLLRAQRPTVFVAIPSMYAALLHAKDAGPADFTSLRFIVSGGEPLPDAVFQGFRTRYGVTLNEGYGLTGDQPRD